MTKKGKEQVQTGFNSNEAATGAYRPLEPGETPPKGVPADLTVTTPGGERLVSVRAERQATQSPHPAGRPQGR